MIEMNTASKAEIAEYLEYLYLSNDLEEVNRLKEAAIAERITYYDHDVYLRGLLEFTSYCKCGCYYCGINRSNVTAHRFRLTKEEILAACMKSHDLGLRTLVLQGGEDPYYSEHDLCDIIYTIKETYPDTAITLSIGEKTREEYTNYFHAGADRYLLRHETATKSHYQLLHPDDQSYNNRMQCLYNLKDIGYQVGAGFMVDAPFQDYTTLANDFLFMKDLKPEMIGIGPFIPAANTRFATYKKPDSSHTLLLLPLLRILLPKALIPATTALATVDSTGYIKGLTSGANVIMPAITPPEMQASYTIYDQKVHLALEQIQAAIYEAGYQPQFNRGDHYDFKSKTL